MPSSLKYLVVSLASLLIFGAPSFAQSIAFGSDSAFSATQSYASNSTHIFIGNVYQRKTEQAGLGYSHKLKRWTNLVLNYEGWVEPLYIEADPTYSGASVPNISGGPSTVVPFAAPYRPLYIGQYLGYVTNPVEPGVAQILLPITGIPGPNEHTYAFAALPVGIRLTGFTHFRVQPTFAVNLGALYATRNIPIDYTSSFNFLAQGGPGVEVFFTRHRSARVEYLYQHLSNADTGQSNPGVDSFAFRFTLTRYRDHRVN